MVKQTQTIRRQQPKNCLSVFDHFMGLALKGLIGAQGVNFQASFFQQNLLQVFHSYTSSLIQVSI